MATPSRKSELCHLWHPFGTSIFTEMSALAAQTGAINLSQGFPDFDGPLALKQAAADALLRGPNQYVPAIGVAPLRQSIAAKESRFYGLQIDADSEVTVTCGASEGLAAALLAIVEPGDEVILLEPCYDLYPPIVARCGAKAVFVSLDESDNSLDVRALERAFSSRTRAIVVNNPQNPSGKVFRREELLAIARLCVVHDTVAIGDEVYEHLVYDDNRHTTLLQIPELRERAMVVSSTAKTFSMTGWKVGYVVAAPPLTEALRTAHQFLTFCTPGALQEAMASAIGMDDAYYDTLVRDYAGKRAKLGDALVGMGFDVSPSQGTYYLSINIENMDLGDDYSFCQYLTTEVGVAAIPTSFFWSQRRGGRRRVRFCFCKQDATLDRAIGRLQKWVSAGGVNRVKGGS